MLRSFVLAGAVLLGMTAPSLAEVARTTGGFVHIRSGPGTNHPAICLAWPGVRFEVECPGGNWCAVDYRRTSGYISAHHVQIED